ncbi:MAG: ATP-grasp domain-containing protein [Bacilli bacterium]
MRNFVFVSCNFPRNYYHFTQGLKESGFNVLGIGDEPYEVLSKELKDSLTEYIYVPDMSVYENMKKACQSFTEKYGQIEFLESNNEYWLEQDARLRSDFNITTGKNSSNIEYFKCKSKEKELYALAGVKTARYHLVDTLEECLKFIDQVSYPIIAKPDNGVGGHATYKIESREQFDSFFLHKSPYISYLLEEFINGDLISFDGVSNSKADIVFCSNEVFPDHFDCVKDSTVDIYYYGNIEIPEDLKEAGRKVLKAFDARYRYFHLEFLRLKEDKPGLGRKGELLGLEANMRAPGGFTPDVINYANSVDSYKIWAKVMANDTYVSDKKNEHFYAMYVGRRKHREYFLSLKEINLIYKTAICTSGVIPEVLADALGDEFCIAKFKTLEEGNTFTKLLTEKKSIPFDYNHKKE